MTAEEFYIAYCERSGIDPSLLATYGKRAYACDCGEDGCEGWAMMTSREVEFDRELGVPTRGISADDPGWAP